MSSEIHRSFAGGEVAPALYSRVDTSRYQTGARQLRNMMVMRHGGAQNRPGTKFICEVKQSSKAVRLIPFVFNESQTYVLELGDFYMRVIKNGAPGLEATKAITGITIANPGIVTSAAHGYSNGEEVAIANIVGMTVLNGRNFTVANVTANTYSLKYPDGTDVNTSTFAVYTSGGTSARVYTIVSPYAYADLPKLKYAQSADIINLAHTSYPPYEIARTGDLVWTITKSSFVPALARPVALTGAVGGAGAVPYQYKVTGISKKDGSESLCAVQASKVITGITQANPAVVTSAAHGYLNGDEIVITGIVGMTQVNNGVFIVANKNANDYQLQGVDSTAYSAYSSGGSSFRDNLPLTSAVPTSAAPNVINWTQDPLVQEYNIYRSDNGFSRFGFLGTSSIGTFNDIGAPVNTTKTPPIYKNPFGVAGGYPGAVVYHQQRLAFANSTNNPLGVNESRVGQYHDFSISSPLQDDDAVAYTLAGERVSEIRHLLFMGKLIAFTAGAEFTVNGDQSGVVTPFAINAKQETGHGSSHLRPINIDNTGLFVQARGSKVRDLNFNFATDGYQGNDLSIFSAHLFDGHTLVDWAFQQEPNYLVWAVRDDGIMVCMTYVREQQIFAWHRHDTDGVFENVASIPENDTDALYVVVKRTVMLNGVSRTVRYIERMAERMVSEQEDAIFMDSSLSYEGLSSNGSSLSLAGSGWDSINLLTLTSAGAIVFDSSYIGKQIIFTGLDGTVIRFNITVFVDVNTVQGFPQKTVPVSMQAVGIYTWQVAVSTFGGLWHLEGKYVSAIGDQFVEASPGDPQYTRLQVTNGQITFANPRSVVHVGLFYPYDVETLDIDSSNGETLVDKGKIISKVTVFLQNSRGGWAGDAPPVGDPAIGNVATELNYVDGLSKFKVRQFESMDDPTALTTNSISAIDAPKWNRNGRVFVRGVDPLPFAVLAIAPAGLTRP